MKAFFNKVRVLNLVSLALNIVNVILVTYAIVGFFVYDFSGTNMPVAGVTCFRYFTNLSNILCAVMSAIVCVFNVKALVSGKNEEPKWASICKFLSTVGVSVTFLVVVFFLGPTQGYDLMFAGPCIYLHCICPLLAIISYAVCEFNNKLKFVETLYGIIPTVLYGIVYFIMVMILGQEKGGWEDFYGFATVIPWYASIFIMPIATYVIAIGLHFLQAGFRKLISGKEKPAEE
ncbi:MAG: hypothetical protein MJ068_02445 [Clostridia bacterium]|nr:hypothetical protein [Clostridia bacterium]